LGRRKQTYSLYARKRKNGKPVYYYRTYGESERRTTGKSTGQISKTAARNYVDQLIKRGELNVTGEITFGRFAENWFVWDKCQYVRSRRARSNITRSYVETERSYLTNHLIPTFKDTKLKNINIKLIESWFLELPKKKGAKGKELSPTTANHCLTTLKIMLQSAVDQELLARNPAKKIPKLKQTNKKRSVPTKDEFKKLFYGNALEECWDGDLQMFTLNFLAATTGMRMGELQGLMFQDLHGDQLTIEHSWNRKYGLKAPKTNRSRLAVLSDRAVSLLKAVTKEYSISEKADYVFCGMNKATPVSDKKISKSLFLALDRIGIEKKDRLERNFTFHTWRHFFNTKMRLRLSEEFLRLLTGHVSEEMTEHYTALTPEILGSMKAQVEEEFGESSANK
jgi:integrase